MPLLTSAVFISVSLFEDRKNRYSRDLMSIWAFTTDERFRFTSIEIAEGTAPATRYREFAPAGQGIENGIELLRNRATENDAILVGHDINPTLMALKQRNGIEFLRYFVDALLAKGWAEEDMYILLDLDVTLEAVEQAMYWLMERVTEEDLVFIYACGHGGHLRETVGLGWAFPPLWRALTTDRKVFVVNSCSAGMITASAMYGEFIEPEQQAELSALLVLLE